MCTRTLLFGVIARHTVQYQRRMNAGRPGGIRKPNPVFTGSPAAGSRLTLGGVMTRIPPPGMLAAR
jgi:hypothetical protein